MSKMLVNLPLVGRTFLKMGKIFANPTLKVKKCELYLQHTLNCPIEWIEAVDLYKICTN